MVAAIKSSSEEGAESVVIATGAGRYSSGSSDEHDDRFVWRALGHIAEQEQNERLTSAVRAHWSRFVQVALELAVAAQVNPDEYRRGLLAVARAELERVRGSLPPLRDDLENAASERLARSRRSLARLALTLPAGFGGTRTL